DGAVTFLLIDIPGVGQGYIDQSKAITRLARTTERDVLVVNTGVAALTIGPGGSNNGELPILTSGDEGYLANVSPDGNFVQLELVDGTRGWLPFSQVSQRTGTTTDINPIDVSSVSTVTTTSAVPGTTATGTIPVVIDTTLGQGGATGVQIIPATPVPIFSQNVIVVNTSALNVRSGPGAQFTTLFTAAGGSQFDVVGLASDGVWFLISGPFGQGWVNNEFVIFRGNIEEVPLIRNATGVIATPIAVIGTSAQLYAAPGTNFGLLGSIVGPVEAPIVARTAEFDWVQINTSAGFGWVLASSVTIRGDVSIIPIVAN
ncbi:MAG: SH3 domain-containing protein, partial [Chloroflexota bacterium]